MKRITLVYALFMIFTLPVVAHASDVLSVENAYAYATSKVQKNGAVFMSLHNTGKVPVRIVAAESDVAERTELHTHLMDGGIMQMREVAGYDVPVGKTVELKPMGHHIMLMGLKKPLKPGDVFQVILMNAQDVAISVDVKVKAMGDSE